MTDPSAKIVALSMLPAWRHQLRQSGLQLVVTNGCFDILHAGHITYLTAARTHGDYLLVGLNSDSSVRRLKGPSRPINPQSDRALVLAALQCVDAVCIFDDLRATHFLQAAQPDIYVKGGDLTIDQIPAEERHAIESAHGRIIIMPHLPGRSTSRVLERLQSPPPHSNS